MFGLRAAPSLTHFQDVPCLSNLVSKGLGGSLPNAISSFDSFSPQMLLSYVAWPILQEGKLRCSEVKQLDWSSYLFT